MREYLVKIKLLEKALQSMSDNVQQYYVPNTRTYIILVAANIHYTKIRHHRFVICGPSVDLVQQ
jgi:hypothetical protein